MSERNSAEAGRAHHRKHSSSNKVLRTITFVLTPFLTLIIVFGIFVLALFKPYSVIKPYLHFVFDPDSTATNGQSQVSLFGQVDETPKVLEADANDTIYDDGNNDDEELHKFIYADYGERFATINIPNAGMKDIPVVAGTTLEVLEYGAGWSYSSVYVGKKGNCVICGHNHTYFFQLPQVKKGDMVFLETDYCKLTYMVSDIVVFHEEDFTYTDPIPGVDRLTLFTCWNNGMLGMSKYRLGVICDIVEREWKDVEVPAS